MINVPSRFEQFAALHVPGDPVILYNVWDAGSAQTVERAGAKAIATGSHPVADANGWPDGQGVPIDFALENAKRVVGAVELPVTVDFEGAYAVEVDDAAANVTRLKATGAVGCNFEDQVIGSEGVHPLELQSRRIEAIRKAVGDDFFINARTDLFLKDRVVALRAGGQQRHRALDQFLDLAHVFDRLRRQVGPASAPRRSSPSSPRSS
jgi:2-methylisocitrate lyase-like PEP mutase family enzyme